MHVPVSLISIPRLWSGRGNVGFFLLFACGDYMYGFQFKDLVNLEIVVGSAFFALLCFMIARLRLDIFWAIFYLIF